MNNFGSAVSFKKWSSQYRSPPGSLMSSNVTTSSPISPFNVARPWFIELTTLSIWLANFIAMAWPSEMKDLINKLKVLENKNPCWLFNRALCHGKNWCNEVEGSWTSLTWSTKIVKMHTCISKSNLGSHPMSETLIRAWHMSGDECEHYGHWLVYIINATLNDLLNQYSATTNHNVENIV